MSGFCIIATYKQGRLKEIKIMQIIVLSKKIDKALSEMDDKNYTIVNNVQGGYLPVEKALELVSEELKPITIEAGQLWTLIDNLDEVENEAFIDWNDDNIDDETLIDILS